MTTLSPLPRQLLPSPSASAAPASSPSHAPPWSCPACQTHPRSTPTAPHKPIPIPLAAFLSTSLTSPTPPLHPSPFARVHRFHFSSLPQLASAFHLLSLDLPPSVLSVECERLSFPPSLTGFVLTHHTNGAMPPHASPHADPSTVRIHEDVEAAAAEASTPAQSHFTFHHSHGDSPPMPALHLGTAGGVSPNYDWKLLPSRPLPSVPLDGTQARPVSSLLSPARALGVKREGAELAAQHSPASAPPSLLSPSVSGVAGFSSASSMGSPSSALAVTRAPSASLPASLNQPMQSRSESAPPIAHPGHVSHPSRYSIVGLPRPRRLAPVSPVIAASAAVFHHPPSSSSPHPLHLSPSSTTRPVSASVPYKHSSAHPRKSWDLRDMWVNREQQEIRKEEEKHAARVKQLTRALNLCRLFPHGPAMVEAAVEGIVKELRIDLAHLDVGHITTMEREELMVDSARTLLATLQLLSSPQLTLAQVKERCAALRLSAEVEEYVIFFFVDAPATFDHASRAYSRQSRSRLSLRHPPLLSSSSAPSVTSAVVSPVRRTSPRDLLSALTTYINRRQTEDSINQQQLARYAKQVGFDLASVDLREAQAVLGSSKDDELKAVDSFALANDEETVTADSVARPLKVPVELRSAKQVVIALQMFYELTVYDDDHVLSICRTAGMPAETVDYLLRKNRQKRIAQQEEDRRLRRQKRRATTKGTPAARPTHWPVTVEDVSAMISNHRMCRGWISDEDELRELIRVTPLDLSQVSPVMLEGLLAADLRFDSPKQVVHALSLLYADLSDAEVAAECERVQLPQSAVRYILEHREARWEPLEVEELSQDDLTAQTVRTRMRRKAARIKAMNVIQYDLDADDADLTTEHAEFVPSLPKHAILTRLTDSLKASQLFEEQTLITEDLVSALLIEHPFPLSPVDLTELSAMEDAHLSFSSPAQLICALELLHVDMDDDAVKIECQKAGMRPAVVQYVMHHERPLLPQVIISREDSRTSKRSSKGSAGKHLNRRSLSLVETLAGGQELVEEWVASSSIADIIGGTTTSAQLVDAVRQARLLDLEQGEEVREEVVEEVARQLEFELSVVDLEMVPILAQHTRGFRTVPQLLTALQLLYTDVSDAEIRSECEELGMDRRTTRFLVKNSLRKLLANPAISKQLDDGVVLQSEDGEIVAVGGHPALSADPRYARVVYAGDDELGMEEQMVQVDGPRGGRDDSAPSPSPAWFTSSGQLSNLVDQFQLLSPSPCSAVEMELALHAVDMSLDQVKLADLAKLAEHKMTFSSPHQLMSTLRLLHLPVDDGALVEEAARQQLPSPVLEYLTLHHGEHLAFIQRGLKKEARWRHQIRYISHDLRTEDVDDAGQAVAVLQDKQRAAVNALQARLIAVDGVLEAGVGVVEEEVEEWVTRLPLSLELQVDCVDLIHDHLQATGHRRFASVQDALQCVVDMSLDIAELAEEEMVSTDAYMDMIRHGERQVPAIIIEPSTASTHSVLSTSRTVPVPPLASHSRGVSMPNSRRSSANGYQLQQQPVPAPPTITGNGSHSSTPSPSPSHTSLKKANSRHHRAAHSVSWNARSRDAILSDPVKEREKREGQIRELKRIIVQNALVMVAPHAVEPPSPPRPPPLLSERRSLPSPTSPLLPSGDRDRGTTVPAVAHSQSLRLLPPPIPSGVQAGYHLKVNGSPSLDESTTSSLPPPLPSSAVGAPVPPVPLVPATLAELESSYAWDDIVDPVYFIHMTCELLKWRAVHQPELTFPSPSALFDFLQSPSCPVFDPEEDALSTAHTAMELTDNDDRDPTITHYDERSLHTLSRSAKSTASALQTQLAPSNAKPSPKPPPLPAPTSPPPVPSPSDSLAPPPLPPTAFPVPPFSPSVVMTMNNPFVYPPMVGGGGVMPGNNLHRAGEMKPPEVIVDDGVQAAGGCCGSREQQGKGSGCVIS